MKHIALTIFTFAVLALSVQAQDRSPLKVSILGDSYSTFEGHIQPAWNAIWYFAENSQAGRQNNDVKRVEQTWWYQVVEQMGYQLEKNNSFSGATICFTGYRQEDYSDRTFIGRSADLGHPDVILVCGGTNDSWCGAPVGEYKWKKWTNEDLYTFRPAMAKLCSELKTLYPSARIVFILNSELREEINESVHTICKRYRIPCLDLHDIDKQGGHPSIAGMQSFATQVVDFLK